MSDAKKMLKELSYTHLVPKDEQGRELVAVVRCKDCRYMSKYKDWRRCNVWHSSDAVTDDGYCNRGRRQDDAKTD